MKRPRYLTSSWPMALLTLALLAAFSLGGCSKTRSLTGNDQAAVLAYSEPTADNLFKGFNAGDYATFSRDFNNQMLQGIPAATFTNNLVPTITGKLGKYISRQVDSVTEIGNDMLVIYTAKFEQDDAVNIRLALEKAGPHHVSGFWFNSSKLNQ
jgi:hypothetical protein